jgi:hypothetical protein
MHRSHGAQPLRRRLAKTRMRLRPPHFGVRWRAASLLAGMLVVLSSLAYAPPAVSASQSPRIEAITAQATVSPDLQPCSDNQLEHCLAPQNIELSTSPPYCQTFPNGLEWEPFTDHNHVAQLYTFSNGSHACIQVNYYPVVNNRNCYYSFYVPDNGYANAHVVIGWWNTSRKKYYTSVPEATSAGWYDLNMNDPSGISGGAVNVTKISFQDNNGQTPGSTYIGWGNESGYEMEQFC